jgi:hypothetical protein
MVDGGLPLFAAGRSPDREPAGQIRLDRKVVGEHRADRQLARQLFVPSWVNRAGSSHRRKRSALSAATHSGVGNACLVSRLRVHPGAGRLVKT